MHRDKIIDSIINEMEKGKEYELQFLWLSITNSVNDTEMKDVLGEMKRLKLITYKLQITKVDPNFKYIVELTSLAEKIKLNGGWIEHQKLSSSFLAKAAHKIKRLQHNPIAIIIGIIGSIVSIIYFLYWILGKA